MEEKQAILARLEDIEERLKALEQRPRPKGNGQESRPEARQETTPREVMGFRLIQKVTYTVGKKYRKWYAIKGTKAVYIGNDPGQAEVKIMAWQEKQQNRKDVV